jgi:hypothetical protein
VGGGGGAREGWGRLARKVEENPEEGWSLLEAVSRQLKVAI